MNRKVLIVDDNNGFARVIREEIERCGHQALVANNGVEALLRYLDGDIDIVLMDVVMPKLSGIDALRIMHKVDETARVVIFTGNPSEEMRVEAMKFGACAFLPKPFSLKELLEIVGDA